MNKEKKYNLYGEMQGFIMQVNSINEFKIEVAELKRIDKEENIEDNYYYEENDFYFLDNEEV